MCGSSVASSTNSVLCNESIGLLGSVGSFRAVFRDFSPIPCSFICCKASFSRFLFSDVFTKLRFKVFYLGFKVFYLRFKVFCLGEIVDFIFLASISTDYLQILVAQQLLS